MPTAHMGPTATALERRGLRSERGDLNREAAQVNEQIKSLENARRELETLSVAQVLPKVVSEPVRRSGPQILRIGDAGAKNQATLYTKDSLEDLVGTPTAEEKKDRLAEVAKKKALDDAKEAEAERERQEVEFWGKELSGQMENAGSRSEYESALLGIARIAEGRKVEHVYAEWVKPYMAVIDDAGPGHREAFRECLSLAKLDATTDKELLQKMKSDLRDALRGMGGTGSQHDKAVKEIMDVVRLHGDRQAGFERVAEPKINEWQRIKGIQRGR